MTTPHRATPEQWAMLEEQSAPEYDSTILELRSRIEKLEASTACPYIVTSDEGTSYCRLAERVAAPTTAEAQPEPQGPTEAELKTFACEWWRSFGFAKDKATCTWVIDQVAPEHFADFSRDVLQRWHRPAIEPVPVAERLPGPEDCDADGRCWWWYPPRRSCYGYWQHEDEATEREDDESPVAWLPHHALPVPQQEVK